MYALAGHTETPLRQGGFNDLKLCGTENKCLFCPSLSSYTKYSDNDNDNDNENSFIVLNYIVQ